MDDMRTVLQALGVSATDIEGVFSAPSARAASERLAALKQRATYRYHQISRDYHPVCSAGDDESLATFELISSVYEDFMGSKPPARRIAAMPSFSVPGVGRLDPGR